MRLGYVRISADTPVDGPGTKSLSEASCDQILVDALNGSRHRVSLACLARIEMLTKGDELVVLKLDHLAPMPELLVLLYQLIERGVIVRSLEDNFDTEDDRVAGIFSVLSHYSRGDPQTKQPTGRHRALDDATAERVRRMIVEEKVKVADIAQRLGVSRSTIYRNVRLTSLKNSA